MCVLITFLDNLPSSENTPVKPFDFDVASKICVIFLNPENKFKFEIKTSITGKLYNTNDFYFNLENNNTQEELE